MKLLFIFFIVKLFINGVFGDSGEVKSVSVMEGDSVTLRTDTEIKSSDVIQWRFEKILISKFDSEKNETNYFEVLNRNFRNRLYLNNTTGDLTIKKIRAEDSGQYTMSIFGTSVLNGTFNIHCVSDSASDGLRSVSAMNRDSVILHTGVVDIQTDDVIEWFGPQRSPIAKLNKKVPDYPNNAFWKIKDRLNLDHQNGDLTIRHIKNDASGLYDVQITKSSNSCTIHRRFNVTVSERLKIESVREGQTVTLWSGVKEPDKDDLILWWFEHSDSPIAKIDRNANNFSVYGGDDGRFRGRLQLDHQTGNLTIMNSRTNDSGFYDVESRCSTNTLFRKFSITVCAKDLPLKVFYAVIGLSAVSVLGLVVAVCVLCYYQKFPKARQQTVPANIAEAPDNVANDASEGSHTPDDRSRAASLLGQPSDPDRGESVEMRLLNKEVSSGDVSPEA